MRPKLILHKQNEAHKIDDSQSHSDSFFHSCDVTSKRMIYTVGDMFEQLCLRACRYLIISSAICARRSNEQI